MTGETFAISVGSAVLPGVSRGEGLPVVFLHAGVCDLRMWEHQMALVEEMGWRAVAYDRRGYGGAESQDEPFSHLDDLEAVLDALDIQAAIFVGCSLGGGLAIDFALRHPGRVIGLVLIGTSVTGAPWTATQTEEAIEMAEEDAWERGDLDLVNRVQAHEWLDGPRGASGRVGGAARELFFDMNGRALAKAPLTQEEERAPAWSRLGEINAPSFLIVGDQDFTTLVDRHEHLSETMPNAFAVVLEGVAHLPSIERPDLINRMLEEFLEAFDGAEDGDDEDDAE